MLIEELRIGNSEALIRLLLLFGLQKSNGSARFTYDYEVEIKRACNGPKIRLPVEDAHEMIECCLGAGKSPVNALLSKNGDFAIMFQQQAPDLFAQMEQGDFSKCAADPGCPKKTKRI